MVRLHARYLKSVEQGWLSATSSIAFVLAGVGHLKRHLSLTRVTRLHGRLRHSRGWLSCFSAVTYIVFVRRSALVGRGSVSARRFGTVDRTASPRTVGQCAQPRPNRQP